MKPPHVLVQSLAGEFAIFSDEARALGPDEFARKYGHSVWVWGNPPTYNCVRHEGTDYLWSLQTGEFDGWDGLDLPPREER